jgi:hypothetical protein
MMMASRTGTRLTRSSAAMSSCWTLSPTLILFSKISRRMWSATCSELVGRDSPGDGRRSPSSDFAVLAALLVIAVSSGRSAAQR